MKFDIDGKQAAFVAPSALATIRSSPKLTSNGVCLMSISESETKKTSPRRTAASIRNGTAATSAHTLAATLSVTSQSETVLRKALAARRRIRRIGQTVSITFLSAATAIEAAISPSYFQGFSTLPEWTPLPFIAALSGAISFYRVEMGKDGVIYASRRAPYVQHRVCDLDKRITIRPTKGKGNGAFVVENIPKGTFLGAYAGELIDTATFLTRYPPGVAYGAYVMAMDSIYLRDGQACAQDANGSFSTALMNHSSVLVNRNVLRVWRRRERQVLFFTSRDVTTGEELCYDYGQAYWTSREAEELP